MASEPAVRDSNSNGTSTPMAVSTLDNFEDLLTMMGGLTDSCFRGYVGQWRTWAPPDPSTTDSTSNDPQMLQEDINFRLFKQVSTDPITVHQINLYQHPAPVAAGYKQYLSGDAMSGRPDGYAVREWTVKPAGILWEADASAWRSVQDSSTPPESALVGLAVKDRSLALPNGALPWKTNDTEAGSNPAPWFLEVIIREPSSHAHRWGILLRYDACQLAHIRTMHEDFVEMAQQQIEAEFINPSSFHFLPRHDRLPADIDQWLAQSTAADTHVTGAAVTLSYDNQHKLTKCTHPCNWSSTHITGNHTTWTFPDGLYIRVPRNIAEKAVTAPVLTLELGAVLSDGCLVRWLVEYDNSISGRRLLTKATYEVYPLVTA
eukprot:GHRR01000693.1.p1 GENE.GHRR01000693.1~~GHRR01000693.1.p1  ORF type:complete len:375 (+),score=108.48 GHRR01000693.1:224-1348(+)